MKILYCKVAEKAEIMEINNTLEEMQNLVGGYIQPFYPPQHEDDAVIICNEEGKINGMRPNRVIYNKYGEIADIMFGNFFICNAPPTSEEFESLTEEQIALYKPYYDDMTIQDTDSEV